MKSLLDTRPIFHKRDETIRGHVFCSFLALLLRKELQEIRLARKGVGTGSGPTVVPRSGQPGNEMKLRSTTRLRVFAARLRSGGQRSFRPAASPLPPVLRSCWNLRPVRLRWRESVVTTPFSKSHLLKMDHFRWHGVEDQFDGEQDGGNPWPSQTISQRDRPPPRPTPAQFKWNKRQVPGHISRWWLRPW